MNSFRQLSSIAATVLILFNVSSLKGQLNLDANQIRMEKQLADSRQTKLYLHTDKSGYVSGDTIWFRCYLTDAGSHQEIKEGLQVRLQLINPEDRIISQPVVKPSDNGYSGFIALDAALAKGIYTLKAFSTTSRHYPLASYFEKEIKIDPLLSALIKTNADFTFTGEQGRISAAISLTDLKTGLPVKPKNMVMNYCNSPLRVRIDKDDAVTSFPVKEGKNPLSIQFGNYEEYIALPPARKDYEVVFFPEGGSLLEDTECQVGFRALSNLGTGEDIYGEIIDSQNKIVTRFKSLYKGIGAFRFIPETGETYIALCHTPDGLTKQVQLPQTTLRNHTLTTSWKGENLEISIKSPQRVSSSEPLFLLVQTRGIIQYFDKVKPGSTCLSIHRNFLQSGVLQVLLLNEKMNALSERLVFNKKNDQATVIFETKKQHDAPRELVTATLSAEDEDGQPVNGLVSVAVTDDYDVQQDSANTIRTALLISSELKGSIESPEFYFQNNNPLADQALDALMLTQKWKRYDIPLALQDKSPVSPFPKNRPTEIMIRTTFEEDSLAVKKAALRYQLETGNTLAYELPAHKSRNKKSGTAINNADYAVSSEEILKSGYRSVHDALRNAAGVRIISNREMYVRSSMSFNPTKKAKASDDGILSITEEVSYNVTDIPPLYILDGRESGIDEINNIPIDNVANIALYKGSNALIYGQNRGGVIVVSTKKGLAASSPGMGSQTDGTSGHATTRLQTSTNQKSLQTVENIPDLQSTIYWNPAIRITGGKGEFSFITSDDNQSIYSVTIEGVSDEGLIIHQTGKIRLGK